MEDHVLCERIVLLDDAAVYGKTAVARHAVEDLGALQGIDVVGIAMTAEIVDPDDLAKSFGPGVRLVRVTIEITGEPVTRGIRKVLPWLSPKVRWFRLGVGDPNMPPLGPANLIDIDNL